MVPQTLPASSAPLKHRMLKETRETWKRNILSSWEQPQPQFHRSETQPHGAGAARYRPWRPQLSCGRSQAPSAAWPRPGSSARDAAVTDTTAEPSGAARVRRESDGSGWAMPLGPVPPAVPAPPPPPPRHTEIPQAPFPFPSVQRPATGHRRPPLGVPPPHPSLVPELTAPPGSVRTAPRPTCSPQSPPGPAADAAAAFRFLLTVFLAIVEGKRRREAESPVRTPHGADGAGGRQDTGH